MKHKIYLFLWVLILKFSFASGQLQSSKEIRTHYPHRKLTTELAIGINPAPTSDMLFSNLLQWNINKRLSMHSYTSYTHVNAFHRNFNYIRNNYNCAFSQKIGLGISIFTKKSSSTFSLLAGIKYNAIKETLNNPEFEKVVVTLNSISPDYGLMYQLKIGKKKYYFSYRMYLPFYPYPTKSFDITCVDGNLANISLEAGVGIRLK